MSDLLPVWRRWASAPASAFHSQILEQDADVLLRLEEFPGVTRWGSWAECAQHFLPWNSGPAPLHTGLVPLPFVGDVQRAKVLFLLLNPGLSATDYFAEYEVPAFRAKLLANLRQDFSDTQYPFFPLDPEFAWHSGATYWEKKLRHVAKALSKRAPGCESCVRRVIAQNVCAIEMVPYHSRNFDLPSQALDEMPSAVLARQFVQQLEQRTERGERLFISMRRVEGWGLPPADHVFRFSGGQARGAHLSTAAEEAVGHRIVDMLVGELRRVCRCRLDHTVNEEAGGR